MRCPAAEAIQDWQYTMFEVGAGQPKAREWRYVRSLGKARGALRSPRLSDVRRAPARYFYSQLLVTLEGVKTSGWQHQRPFVAKSPLLEAFRSSRPALAGLVGIQARSRRETGRSSGAHLTSKRLGPKCCVRGSEIANFWAIAAVCRNGLARSSLQRSRKPFSHPFGNFSSWLSRKTRNCHTYVIAAHKRTDFEDRFAVALFDFEIHSVPFWLPQPGS